MRILFLIVLIFLTQGCGGPKSVLLCGDHVCVNKKEANQYFQENLSLEVKITNNQINDDVDLIELNLREEVDNKKIITIKKKDKTNKPIKKLSKKEIKIIKSKIKKKDEIKKIGKKRISSEKKLSKENKNLKDHELVVTVKKRNENLVDVCTIIKKCSIDEISKYLLKEGRKKGYPEIADRK